MENINTPLTPSGVPDLPKSKSTAALISGILILVGSVASFIAYTLQEITFYGQNASKMLVNILPFMLGQLLSYLPFVLIAIYMLACFRKNPAHALFKVPLVIFAVLYILVSLVNVGIISNYLENPGYYDHWTDNELFDYIKNAIYCLIFAVCYVIFSVTVFGRFKNYKLGKIFQIIYLSTYTVNLIINIILYSSDYSIFSYIGIFFGIMTPVGMTVFWLVCIDASTKFRVPAKKSAPKPSYIPPARPSYQPVYTQPTRPVAQPVTQPVYQSPVQPVSQPTYQPPVQPVYQVPVQPTYQPAQPVYQTPPQPVVQNTAPANNSQISDIEATLNSLRSLLESGMITQEDFEKKKAEILERL